MREDRLITIAIHTYEKAHELKNILKCEKGEVTLQNVNLSNGGILRHQSQDQRMRSAVGSESD